MMMDRSRSISRASVIAHTGLPPVSIRCIEPNHNSATTVQHRLDGRLPLLLIVVLLASLSSAFEMLLLLMMMLLAYSVYSVIRFIFFPHLFHSSYLINQMFRFSFLFKFIFIHFPFDLLLSPDRARITCSGAWNALTSNYFRKK